MAMADDGRALTEDQVRKLYEEAESSSARVLEELVATRGFGWVLARSAENIAALVRISADFSDLIWRNLRVAGRADITRLSRQLHRTEDKLERVLQEVEALRDELERAEDRSLDNARHRARPRTSRSAKNNDST
jgi:hypothetical protein